MHWYGKTGITNSWRPATPHNRRSHDLLRGAIDHAWYAGITSNTQIYSRSCHQCPFPSNRMLGEVGLRVLPDTIHEQRCCSVMWVMNVAMASVPLCEQPNHVHTYIKAHLVGGNGRSTRLCSWPWVFRCFALWQRRALGFGERDVLLDALPPSKT